MHKQSGPEKPPDRRFGSFAGGSGLPARRGVDVLDLVQGAGDSALAIDAAGNVVAWNRSAERLLGFKEREVAGRPVHEVLDCRAAAPRGSAGGDCPLLATLDQRTPPVEVAFLARHRSGSVIEISGSVVLLPAAVGARALFLLRPTASGVLQRSSFTADDGAGAHHPEWPGSGDELSGSLNQLLTVTGADAAELFVVTSASGHLLLAAHQGQAPRAFREQVRFDVGQGFPGLVAQTGEPLLSLDLLTDERYLRAGVKRHGFRSYVCVPIWGGSGLLGSLHLAWRQRASAVAEQLPFLRQVAHEFGARLELARLRAAEHLTAHALAPSVDAGANLRQVADLSIQSAMDAAVADCAALLVVDELTGALLPLSERGTSPRVHRTLSRGLEPEHCPAVARHGCVLPTDPIEAEPPCCRTLRRDLSTKICLPVAVGEQTLGVLALGWHHREALPARHAAFLQEMMDSTAVMLHNARVALREECEAASRTMLVALQAAERRHLPGPEVQTGPEDAAATPVGPLLDIRCLGRFTVIRDGQTIPPERFARRRSLTLLKILLSRYGKRVHREELMDLLCPDAEERSAASLLHIAAHYLRRALEPDLAPGQASHFIITSGDYYAFNLDSAHRLDSQEFLGAAHQGAWLETQARVVEAAAACGQAVALYRGDFLEDEQYSDWCALEREYLRETFLTVLRRTARLHAQQGETDAAVKYFRRALQVEPTLEDVHGALMELFWRTGRRDEALRQYAECRAVLERELGVSPLPSTEALRQRIAQSTSSDPATS